MTANGEQVFRMDTEEHSIQKEVISKDTLEMVLLIVQMEYLYIRMVLFIEGKFETQVRMGMEC